jgi:hypothetical protein
MLYVPPRRKTQSQEAPQDFHQKLEAGGFLRTRAKLPLLTIATMISTLSCNPRPSFSPYEVVPSYHRFFILVSKSLFWYSTTNFATQFFFFLWARKVTVLGEYLPQGKVPSSEVHECANELNNGRSQPYLLCHLSFRKWTFVISWWSMVHIADQSCL